MNWRFLGPLGVCALAVSWGFLPEFTLTLLCYIGLYTLVVLGLTVLTGIGGMTSFGQAAFVGLSAYATAWVCTNDQWAVSLGLGAAHPLLPWIGLLVGLTLTACVAWFLGGVTLRLSGHYLPLCTIAWGLSLYYLFGNLDFLGGHTGISGIQALQVGEWSLNTPRSLGIVIWGCVLLSMWGLHNLLDSRNGRAIRSLKNTRVMAESMGIDTHHYRLKVFILAALLAAVSGWLYAHLQRYVNPTPFNLNIGIGYLFMAVVGGAGYLGGALLGAVVITLMREQIQDWLPKVLGQSGDFETIVFGLLMLLVLQHFPNGLWGTLMRWMPGGGASAGLRRAPHVTPTSSHPHSPRADGAPKHAAPSEVLLSAQGVTRRFGGLVANESVSLELKAGEIHALIGPNGAGKSTFFNLLSGLDVPDAGQVCVRGHVMNGKPSRDFAALGVGRSFQHVKILTERSVFENVALGAHLQGRSSWCASILRLDRQEEAALLQRAASQIQRCGLQEHLHTPAGDLALGQQRIVEIARALTTQPKVLLLDEPAAGLRHLEKQALAQLLKQLRQEGLGILIVEHDMEFVMTLADRVSVLEFGHLIAQGTPEQVQADPKVLAAYLGTEEGGSVV